MEDNKLLTIEELIEIAKQQAVDPTIRARDLTEVDKFVIANELAPGNIAVPFESVYQLYRKWSKKPKHRISFGKQIAGKFERRRRSFGHVFMLNKEIINEEEKE